MGYLAGALLWHSICVSDDVFIPARLFLRSLEICDAKIQTMSDTLYASFLNRYKYSKFLELLIALEFNYYCGLSCCEGDH